MREVEIDEQGVLVDVYCPVAQLHRTDRLNCANKCAWFRKEEIAGLAGQPPTFRAYCKDHCIGKIKESE